MFLLEVEHILKIPAVINWSTAEFVDLVGL